MENDDRASSNLLEIKIKNIFKFKQEYKGQHLNNNSEFLKWKKEMETKYGNNAKLFKCLIDDIYFYTSYKDYNTFPFYQSICPLCQTPTCYFCNKYGGKDDLFSGNCCIKRRIRCQFLKDGFTYIIPSKELDEAKFKKFKHIFIVFFIPVFNILFLILELHLSFFYEMIRKDARNDKKRGELYNEVEIYLREHNIFCIVATINIGFALLISIPFIILYYIFLIVLFIISIPFKLYPLFFFLGIIVAERIIYI